MALIMNYCLSADFVKSYFTFIRTDQGIELKENGKPVFFYQNKQKTLSGQYICNNYLHPLYSLDGDTLTEESPADHPYHRGVFWTWHQLFIDNESIGDGWINDGISQDVVKTFTSETAEFARITTEVMWKSSVFRNGKPFMNERTTITAHKTESDIRKIDFEITLSALVDGLQIGGSADEKGYGGFCVRMKLPDNLVFTSDKGPVTPKELQVKAGPWMDFSGSFGNDLKKSGITILCHPSVKDYPEPWILRLKGSMQNIVFPGRNRIDLPAGKPVVLNYRIIIHRGDAGMINIPSLQSGYSATRIQVR